MSFRRGGAKKRRDANERPIVAALKGVGADVTHISGLGAPDLLVRWRGGLWAFEVKTATGKLKPSQVKSQWPIVRSPEEALGAIGALSGVGRVYGD